MDDGGANGRQELHLDDDGRPFRRGISSWRLVADDSREMEIDAVTCEMGERDDDRQSVPTDPRDDLGERLDAALEEEESGTTEGTNESVIH